MKRLTAVGLAVALVLVGAQAASASTGKWTSPSLTMTSARIGAVYTGMTIHQASVAAGVTLTTAGDGQYSSPRAPGLLAELGWGTGVCLAATAPAHVHTPAGMGLGSNLSALKAVYGSNLHWHTAPAGFSDPRSWYIHNSAGYLFFHLNRITYGHVVRMGNGPTLRDAYC